jgi:hypothetical protein
MQLDTERTCGTEPRVVGVGVEDEHREAAHEDPHALERPCHQVLDCKTEGRDRWRLMVGKTHTDAPCKQHTRTWLLQHLGEPGVTASLEHAVDQEQPKA